MAIVRALLVLALFPVGVAGVARADVVGPPPASCPAGSTPSSSHSGPLCSPEPACMTSMMCGGGEACEEVRHCIIQRACGGRMEPDAGPCFVDHVVSLCDGAGGCAEGTCRNQNTCIVPGSARGGCACTVGQRSVGLFGLGGGSLSIVAFALLAFSRSARYVRRR